MKKIHELLHTHYFTVSHTHKTLYDIQQEMKVIWINS